MSDNPLAYHQGRVAFFDGKRKSANPYKGTKAEAVKRVYWLMGYADAAKQDAADALNAWAKEEEKST